MQIIDFLTIFRQRECKDGLINIFPLRHFKVSLKMKPPVNISLFSGVLKEIYKTITESSKYMGRKAWHSLVDWNGSGTYSQCRIDSWVNNNCSNVFFLITIY